MRRDAQPTPRPRNRYWERSFERRIVALRGPGGNGLSTTVSTERHASWKKRRFYSIVVLGQLPNAQRPTYRPTRRVERVRTVFAPGTLRGESVCSGQRFFGYDVG